MSIEDDGPSKIDNPQLVDALQKRVDALCLRFMGDSMFDTMSWMTEVLEHGVKVVRELPEEHKTDAIRKWLTIFEPRMRA